MTELKERTVRGLAWSAVGRFGTQALRFSLSVVLARLLAPADFGLVGMVLVFTGLATVVAELGLGASLVHRWSAAEDIDGGELAEPGPPGDDAARSFSPERALGTVLVFTAAIGVSLAGVFFVAAPFLARLYDEPRVTALARALGAVFLLAPLGVVPRAVLTRRLAFAALARAEIAASLVAGAAGVGAALAGLGVWSLVALTLVNAALDAVLPWVAARTRPRPCWDAAQLRALLAHGAHLAGWNLLTYASRTADNLIIGARFGSAPLGIYGRAYSLMFIPVHQITGVAGRVMFPVLSSIQDDRPRIARIWLRSVGAIGLAIFPMVAGLAVVADDLVPVLFGERWAAVAPVLRILCGVGAIHALLNPTVWLYHATGRTGLLFLWGVVSSIALVGAFVIGASLGSIESVATLYLAASAALAVPGLLLPARLVDIRAGAIIRRLAPSAARAAVMAALVFALRSALPETLGQLGRLLITIPTGVAAYVGPALLLQDAVVRDVLDTIRSGRPRAP